MAKVRKPVVDMVNANYKVARPAHDSARERGTDGG